MNDAPKPVIAMVQGATILILLDGRQIPLPVGCMIYAAEIAAAINRVTSETLAGEED